MQVDNAPGVEEPAMNIGRMLTMLRRRWLHVVVGCIIGLALALGYVATATPRYAASSSLLLDTQMNDFLQKQNIAPDTTVDTGLVDSQVEVLTSESVALSVIRELGLTKDPEFVGPPSGVLGKFMVRVSDEIASIKRRFGADAPEAPDANGPERTAVDTFLRRLTAKRVGLTYVIDISFESETPAKAAMIANAVAQSYITGELSAKFDSTKRASSWLQDRLRDLRDQATEADRAVQNFKTANGIVDTGRGLMGQQQISDLNSQIITAQSATAEAKARLDRIQHVNSNDLVTTTVTDALSNPVITRLRAQYLDLAARESDWSGRFGPNHVAAVRLRSQMDQIKKAIADEVQRIADAYESDYQIAKAREDSLSKSLSGLVGEAGTSNLAQVKLRDLESSAESYRTLYDNFLQKSQQATQQESSPVTNTRIITLATPPLKKSSPKTTLALAAGMFLGMFMGAGVGFMREWSIDVFQTVDEVERNTGVACLGILPTIVRRRRRSAHRRTDEPDPDDAVLNGISEYVLQSPFTRFSETLRNVKVSIDTARGSRGHKVIGVTSSVPAEGKTTIAINLAHLIASNKKRTLLIDGDLHQRTITSDLYPQAREGLIEAIADRSRLRQLVKTNPRSGLDVLPCVLGKRVANAAEILSSRAMEDLLAVARDLYDYVVIDFAPTIPVVDAKATAHLIDTFVFVVAWGRSNRKIVTEALSDAEPVRDRLTGIVLNQADPAALGRIESYKNGAFGNYYVE